jgi:hypothetical protein
VPFLQSIFTSIPLFCFDTDEVLTPSLDFSGIFSLYSIWNAKLKAFLHEQSYLIEDISSSIKSLLIYENISSEIDFEEIAKANVERERKTLADKLKKYESQKKMKQEYLKLLQDQVAQTNKRKSQLIEDAKLQEIKDEEYFVMRDKRDLDEQKRVRMKHFGDENVVTPSDKKDLFNRLHSAPARCMQDYQSAGELLEVQGSASVGEPKELEKLGAGGGDFVDGEFPWGDMNSVVLPDLEATKDVGEVVCVTASDQEMILEVENEEKFDPDKVITKDPPPYRTCISLDSGTVNTR